MFGRRKQAVHPSEKRELESVKKRLDKIEPRVDSLEHQLKLMRREP